MHVPAEAAADLDRWLGGGTWSATPLAGDASQRTYFRVRTADASTRILTFYPRAVRADLARFMATYEAIRDVVPVPSVIERGESVILQEDVGDLSLTSLLENNPGEAVKLYREAAALLSALSEAGEAAPAVNPPFDRAKFAEELDMTRRFYVERLAGAESAPLEEPFAHLAERLTAHRYTLCHRDYHGQNLHVFNHKLYLLDYQDMRMGPDMYDLASLLRDRGVWKALGSDFESDLIERRAKTLGEPSEIVRERYLECLLQRSIKALGTFARLVVVYERRQYLAYIGPTLESVRECASELEGWRDLLRVFPFEFKTP